MSTYAAILVLLFFFISFFIAFTSYSILRPYSIISVSILITSVLNCASDRLAISFSLSCIFSRVLMCSFLCAFFWVLCACYVVRGGALGIRQGRATQVNASWYCMWGWVREGTIPLAQFLAIFQSLLPLPMSKLGPSGADSQVGGFV